MIKLMSFLLAAVSVLLEFTLAQILTVFHGSTATVYFLTIGLYSFFLGVGAFFFHWSKVYRKDSQKVFFYSEAGLVLVASISPFLILLSGQIENIFLKLTVGFLPLSIIAFFSGVELPFLLSNIHEKREKDQIIFWDFFGMFVAGVAFAVFFLDIFSIFQTLAFSIFFTSASILFLLKWFNKSIIMVKGLMLLMIVVSALMFFGDHLLIHLFRGAYGY